VKFFLVLVVAISLYAKSPGDNAVALIKLELSEKKFTVEYSRFLKFKRSLDSLEEIQKKLKTRSAKGEQDYLDSLLRIQKKSNSLIVSQLMLNQTLKLVNIKDSVTFNKYSKSSVDLLYSHKICDGFLFMGDFIERSEGNKPRAFRVYENGVAECLVKWKRFELVSRLRSVKQKLGKYNKEKI
jgi:hypothetical protein